MKGSYTMAPERQNTGVKDKVPGPEPRKWLGGRRLGEWRANLLFIGPIFIVFTILFIVPFVQGIYYAFTDWDAINPNMKFVGLSNFIKIFTVDSTFLPAMGRTMFFVTLNFFGVNVLAMLFAIALTNKFRINNIIRSAIFLPNVISMVIAGFIWQFMYLKVFPQVGESVPALGFLDQNWLSNPSLVMISVVIVSVWQGTGYIMTIYIAGLQGLDESQIEAARLDGANGWQMFWKVKLPGVLPAVAVGAFMNVAGSFKIFDIVYSLTSGGPGHSSEVAMLELYREAYVSKNFGYACAKAVILALVIIIVTICQMYVTSEKKEKPNKNCKKAGKKVAA